MLFPLMYLVTVMVSVCSSKPMARVSRIGMYRPIKQSLDANCGFVPVRFTASGTVCVQTQLVSN